MNTYSITDHYAEDKACYIVSAALVYSTVVQQAGVTWCEDFDESMKAVVQSWKCMKSIVVLSWGIPFFLL